MPCWLSSGVSDFIAFWESCWKVLFADLLWEKNTIPWLISQAEIDMLQNETTSKDSFRTHQDWYWVIDMPSLFINVGMLLYCRMLDFHHFMPSIHHDSRVTRTPGASHLFSRESFPCLHIVSALGDPFLEGKENICFGFCRMLTCVMTHDPTLFSSCHALFLTAELHMMGWLLLLFSERLLQGLKRVSWEKVDVSFHNSKVRSAAHSVIQVLPLPPGGVLSYSEVKICFGTKCHSSFFPCQQFSGQHLNVCERYTEAETCLGMKF